jgi:hypothetical protein
MCILPHHSNHNDLSMPSYSRNTNHSSLLALVLVLLPSMHNQLFHSSAHLNRLSKHLEFLCSNRNPMCSQQPYMSLNSASSCTRAVFRYNLQHMQRFEVTGKKQMSKQTTLDSCFHLLKFRNALFKYFSERLS